VFGAAVPEASVHKNRDTLSGEYKVGPTWDGRVSPPSRKRIGSQ